MILCLNTFEETEITKVDNGFYYEYGSIYGYNNDVQEVCTCCYQDNFEVDIDEEYVEIYKRYYRRFGKTPDRAPY